MNRITPFDLTFGDDVEERFSAVKAEALLSQRDSTDLAQFASLSAVQHLLTEIESPQLLKQDPAAAEEYLALLFASFRFWDCGKQVMAVERRDWDEASVASLGTAAPTDVPSGAYLQLPEQWFWAQINASAPHEPLDGCFVVKSDDERLIVVVASLGLRAGRSGFSQISLRVAPEELIAARSISRYPPFAPLMEGGIEAGFRSIESPGELLVVVQLAIAQATG
jgi:hypothetical protein